MSPTFTIFCEPLYQTRNVKTSFKISGDRIEEEMTTFSDQLVAIDMVDHKVGCFTKYIQDDFCLKEPPPFSLHRRIYLR